MPITPGPWGVKQYFNPRSYRRGGESYGFIQAHKGHINLSISEIIWQGDDEEAAANAQAIAAVPDMVDALKAAEKVFYEMAVVDIPAWRMVRDALAKAEGREP